MTQAQAEAERCGMIPEESQPWLVAEHMAAYAFLKPRIADQRVLEVGFGDGYGAAYASETAQAIVGVDIAPANIPRAQAKYPKPNLTFQHFDGAHLPFTDNSFDAACSFQVIEHIPEPQILPWLTEIHRVLKPGGELYLSTPNLEAAQKPGKPYTKLIYHEKEFTAPELDHLLKEVFEKISLFGEHLTRKHRFFRRLKKWGLRKLLPAPINIVDRYFYRMTIRDFTIHQGNVRQAIHLIAICQKS